MATLGEEKRLWQKIQERPEFEDAEALAELLSRNQHWFEKEAESEGSIDRPMVILSLTQFYHRKQGFLGHEIKAWRVFKAFQLSDCGEEVKRLIFEVATTLYLGSAYRSRCGAFG